MPAKTRAQWATLIRTATRDTVRAMIEIGKLLLAAKAELPHGEFIQMVRRDLPFKERVAQRLMHIARNPALANASVQTLLPAHLGTLTQLAKLPPETLAAEIEGGEITPATRRVGVKVTHQHLHVRSVAYVRAPDGNEITLTGHEYERGGSILLAARTPDLRVIDRLDSAIEALANAPLDSIPREILDCRLSEAIDALTKLRITRGCG
jgi:DUF3102 family protein